MAVGCSKDYEMPTSLPDANFKITFALPDVSRADELADYSDPINNEGTDNMLRIEDLEIYFFNPDGSFVSSITDIKDIRLTPVSSEAYNPHYHLYSAEMRVDGLLNGETYRIVILANRRPAYQTYLPFCTPKNNDWIYLGQGNTDEEKLYSTLEFNYRSAGISGINNYTKLNFMRDERAYVPMWGFKELKAKIQLGENQTFPDLIPDSGQIDLIRSVAKVKVCVSEELSQFVRATTFNPATGKGGIRLYNTVKTGYMTPAYNKVASLYATPDMVNFDKNNLGQYTNDWVNVGESGEDESSAVVYPLFERRDENGQSAYYTYLPEAKIGQAWMNLEFESIGPDYLAIPKHEYTLEFAEYLNKDSSPLARDILKFPVMRNHYYIYTIIRLNPIEFKFEVCEWRTRESEFEFN